MKVNIYIGFWTLKIKCTQYGFYGQAALKNAKEILFFQSWIEWATIFRRNKKKLIFVLRACPEAPDRGPQPLQASNQDGIIPTFL